MSGIDPDLDRAPHLRAPLVALVFVGGTLGTLARYLLTLAIPAPPAVFAINVVGAFLLAFLVEALARRGTDAGARRGWRLFLGTGVLGGFTTYSAFALGADGLLVAGDWAAGLGYSLATVIVGAAASAAGLAVGAATAPRSAR